MVAWNRIRVYLQTYKKSSFAKQQLIVTFVSAINVVLLVVVFVSTFFDRSPSASATQSPPPLGPMAAVPGGPAAAAAAAAATNGTGAELDAVSRLSRGEVGIFLLQVAIHQFCILSFIMAILWTGALSRAARGPNALHSGSGGAKNHPVALPVSQRPRLAA
eukprot:SAG22_NODE_1916_length_3316_cov_6.514454_2_plen_161_part_00